MLSESARNCAFVFHARLLELCFLGGLVCRRSFWTLFGFKISATVRLRPLNEENRQSPEGVRAEETGAAPRTK